MFSKPAKHNDIIIQAFARKIIDACNLSVGMELCLPQGNMCTPAMYHNENAGASSARTCIMYYVGTSSSRRSLSLLRSRVSLQWIRLASRSELRWLLSMLSFVVTVVWFRLMISEIPRMFDVWLLRRAFSRNLFILFVSTAQVLPQVCRGQQSLAKHSTAAKLDLSR